MKRIEIRKPDDFHIHLRQGELLKMTVPHCSAYFSRAVVMPNTIPPIDSASTLEEYRRQIVEIDPGFNPLMTFKLLKNMKESDVRALKKAGAIAGKLYPAGATTNSTDGITDWRDIAGLLKVMEEEQLVLSIHGEDPSVYSLDREKAYIPEILEICRKFPGLKVVFEHLSSAEGIQAVAEGPDNLAGTITVHHLLLTLDDVIGGALNPHNFCKPVLKGPEDRKAIQKVVLEGNRKFFFGSDSAPHSAAKKQEGAAGSYSAPVSLALLAEFFDGCGKLPMLEDFVSRFGAEFYGMPLNEERIELAEESWIVPEAYGEVIPFFASKVIRWIVKN
ncbi:MAG: dihydroorotase [Spirochaetales bacterium]|nr:dihydroorotase [Spirochaetales bacterium]